VTSKARSRGRNVTGTAISEQLISAGAAPVQVRRLARQGRLQVVRRGVYAPAELAAAAVEDHVKRHAMRLAAVAAASDYPTVGSHQTAAVLHGLDLIGRPSANLVTVTRSPRDHGSRGSRAGVRVHSAELPVRHVVVRDGIRLTSVARTVVDLARTCSFRDGVVVADAALRTGQTSLPEISSVICDCARWPGVRRARAVAAFSDRRAESALESLGRVVFREYRLPAPELQVWVGGDLGVVGRADYFWPRYRTIAEADGAIKYADPRQAMRQLDRDARLRDAGFEVVHFTWQEITLTPWQVAERIRAAFVRGAVRGRLERQRPVR
jgi:very-short-patch-repair endonuclease